MNGRTQIVVTEQWLEDLVQWWATNFPQQKRDFEKKLENMRKLYDFDGHMGIAPGGDMQLAVMLPDVIDFHIYQIDKRFDAARSPTLLKHFKTYSKKRPMIMT